MNSVLGLPLEASAQSAGIDALLVAIHWMIVLLFAGWGVFFLSALVRFRRKRNPRANYAGARGRTPALVEAGVAAAEAVLLIGFALPIWVARANAFPDAKNATVVRVVAEQYVWNVHYPGPDGVFGRTDPSLVGPDNPVGLDRNDPAAKDDIVTINQLNLPVNRPVIVHLTTKDVIHSFSIPLFRVKQDAIPGQSIPLWFTPTMTSDEAQRRLARPYSLEEGSASPELTQLVAMEDYHDSARNLILAKGSPVTEDLLPSLRSAGFRKILAAPGTPIEIACAQLCGLGHYRMRGIVNVQTPDEFTSWIADQETYLTGSNP